MSLLNTKSLNQNLDVVLNKSVLETRKLLAQADGNDKFETLKRRKFHVNVSVQQF